MGASYLGDFPVNATVFFLWNTNGQDGASITRSADGTLKIFKGNATVNTWKTERSSLNGVTQTEDFDTDTGVHAVSIDLSDNTDAGFYAAGNEYQVVMSGMTIDTKTVNAVIAYFSIERSGGALALLKSNTYGLAQLVRSTTPANTLAVDAAGKVATPDTQKVDLNTLKTQAITCAAGVTILPNVGFAGAPGANNGAPTTNGTKLNQTVDLTAGQSIACSDKTGFSLSATGADLILKSSTFIQAIVAAINEFATYGLTALNTLLTVTGIKATSIPNATVGGYAAGQDPATLVLMTPANKLETDASGHVTANVTGSVTVAGDVTLAAAQPNYAPAKAGDAMTLTAAYDPAKTAAQAAALTTVDGIVDAIKLKTDNLPVDPADESLLEAAIAGVSAGDATQAKQNQIIAAIAALPVPGNASIANQNAIINAIAALPVPGDATIANQNIIIGGIAGISSPPTTAQIADKLLGRSIAGGADGGRTVQDALRFNRNRVEIDLIARTIVVYAEDDLTPAWTGALSTSAITQHVVGVDPA